MSFSRILIAVDGSQSSFEAARTGFALAATLGAKMATIYAVEPRIAYTAAMAVMPGDLLPDPEAEGKDAEQALRAAVSVPDAAEMLVRSGVGPVAQIITDAASEWQADLVVIGSHGRSGFGRVLLGSVAEAVVRGAPCPVLVVRGKKGG